MIYEIFKKTVEKTVEYILVIAMFMLAYDTYRQYGAHVVVDPIEQAWMQEFGIQIYNTIYVVVFNGLPAMLFVRVTKYLVKKVYSFCCRSARA